MKQILNSRFVLILISSLLLGFSWFPIGFVGFVFLAFIPLFFFLDKSLEKGVKTLTLFPYTFLLFGLSNLFTSWWISKAGGAIGLVAPILVNGIVMSIPVLFTYHLTKKLENKYRFLGFIALWTAMEYLHSLNWDLSWPWMFLGNTLSPYPVLYQWFEFTGVRGGTIWILIVNVGLYKWIKAYLLNDNIKHVPFLMNNAIRLVLPMAVSLVMYWSVSYEGKEIQTRVVQPNIDPYTQKFDQTLYRSHEQLMLELSFENSKGIDLIVLPETSFPVGLWEEKAGKSPLVARFQSRIRTNEIKMVATGISSYAMKPDTDNPPISYRKNRYGYFEVYNSGMMMDGKKVGFYHKSRLVAGVEQMPFASSLPFLKDYARDLGGTTGVMGSQKEREVFTKGDLKLAPIICYESVYSDFVTEYINKGANLLAIMTNDGWWGDTPGYHQHFHYARLRAVENRRYIVRSANTGISGVINQKGQTIKTLPYGELGVIDVPVQLIEEKTFFSKYGDWLGRLGSIAALYFVLVSYIKKYRELRLLKS